MTSLIVVGAGFWGVATALLAESLGAQVTLVGDDFPDGASRASSGYFARSWYKGVWQGRANVAEEVARRFGVDIKWTGADVSTLTNRRAGSSTRTIKSDWAVFTPSAFLALRPADVRASVAWVAPGCVRLTNGRVLEASAIVVAAGAHTDKLLAASELPTLGVTGLPGRGIIYRVERQPPRTILHQVTAFHSNSVRPWGEGCVRVGETVEIVDGKQAEYVEKLRTVCAPYITELGGVAVDERWGVRPLVGGGPVVTEVAPRVVAASGGGRVGGILSFWAAQAACHILRIR